MPGYLTQVAERGALEYLTATASATGVPADTVLRSYLLRLYQQQGLTGLAGYLPVGYLNNFATQAKADSSGSWLTGLIGGRTDGSGSVYLALLTGDPGRQATIDQVSPLEVTAAGYSRQVVPWRNATSPAAGGSGSSNSAPAIFGPFTASGGMGAVATHAALMTSPSTTGGFVLAVWALDNPVSAAQNTNVVLAADGLAMGLDTWQT